MTMVGVELWEWHVRGGGGLILLSYAVLGEYAWLARLHTLSYLLLATLMPYLSMCWLICFLPWILLHAARFTTLPAALVSWEGAR